MSGLINLRLMGQQFEKAVFLFVTVMVAASFSSRVQACRQDITGALPLVDNSQLDEMRAFYASRVPELPEVLNKILNHSEFSSRVLRANKSSPPHPSGNKVSSTLRYVLPDSIIANAQLFCGFEKDDWLRPQFELLQLDIDWIAMSKSGQWASSEVMHSLGTYNSALVQVLSSLLFESFLWMKEHPEVRSYQIRIIGISNQKVTEALLKRGFSSSTVSDRPSLSLQVPVLSPES